jgi:type I restriction enzyme, S subunit
LRGGRDFSNPNFTFEKCKTRTKGWHATELQELCEYVQRGKAPSYVEESEVRVLNQRAIRWGKIEEDYLKFHDSDVAIPKQHFIRAGDVVINSTGDITIGRAFLFKTTPQEMFADSHVTIVRTNARKLRPEYLVNLLATREYQDLIYSMVTGSTGQLEFNKSNLQQLPILHPPIELQERLCELMEPLYQSIELCDEMRRHCEDAIAGLLDVHVLDEWKETRWAN